MKNPEPYGSEQKPRTKNEASKTEIELEDKSINQVNWFIYLGSRISVNWKWIENTTSKGQSDISNPGHDLEVEYCILSYEV